MFRFPIRLGRKDRRICRSPILSMINNQSETEFSQPTTDFPNSWIFWLEDSSTFMQFVLLAILRNPDRSSDWSAPDPVQLIQKTYLYSFLYRYAYSSAICVLPTPANPHKEMQWL